MRSSLNFIVPIVSLVSVIPAALAWKYGIMEKVTFTDPNFYQAIAGSVLQLLSLVTFIWPTLSHPRLSRLNWVWIWILAGCSTLCALTSPLLYWFFSTTWSFLISFIGAIFQAVIQLQLINSISSAIDWMTSRASCQLPRGVWVEIELRSMIVG